MSVLSSTLALLLTCGTFLIYEVVTFENSLVRGVTSEARMLAFNVSAPLLFDDPQAAQSCLEALKIKGTIRSATMTRSDGSVFAVYGKWSTPYTPLELQPSEESRHRFEAGRLLVSVPIRSGDAVIGSVTLESTLEEGRHRIERYLLLTALVLVLALLAAIGVSLWLQREIVRPIALLTEAARRVSKAADYSVRVTATDDGELGQLGNTFNEMLARLEKQSLELQRESEQRFSLLVDGVKDYAIFMLDPEGRVETWNSGAVRLTGYRAEEIIGRHLEVLYPPEEAKDGKPRLALEAAAREGRHDEEGFRLRTDGTRFWADVVITAVTDAAGQLRGFSNITRDMTERRKAEEKFRGLLESAPDAMVITDTEGNIILVNVQTEKLFGYARTELVGLRASRLLTERFRESSFAALASGSRGEGLELWGHRKDHSEFPLEISSSPLDTTEGLLFSNAIRDITDRKRAEVALKVANRELEAFSYSVAHDLRAPLRGMNGFATILLADYGDKLDAEGKDCLKEIHTNAVRMAGLIDSLLSLSRVTRSEVKLQSINVTEMARSIATELAAAEPGRVVNVEVAEGLRASLDSALARTLLENLLRNAWKFTSKNAQSKIEVGIQHDDGTPAFFVRDNGVGFDMAYASKLFAPFQRLHTVAEFAGTGIGLATVQRIVHRHGGQIWARGTVGQGATFLFTLPAAPAGDPT